MERRPVTSLVVSDILLIHSEGTYMHRIYALHTAPISFVCIYYTPLAVTQDTHTLGGVGNDDSSGTYSTRFIGPMGQGRAAFTLLFRVFFPLDKPGLDLRSS